MAKKNNNNLFFTCSLIEYIGRNRKQHRREITDYLGRENIKRIYDYADVFHCEPIQKVAAEFIFRKGNLTMYPCADIRFRITGILEKYMSD